jgi:hypothetical protein
MSDFYKTRAGMQFYQGTMPKIAEALERIADTLDKQVTLLELLNMKKTEELEEKKD